MSLYAAESQHLLPHPPSSQETHYDTFEESNVVSTGEGQSQLQVVLEIPDSGQDNANQTPNEPEHNSQQSQWRSFQLCRVISSCLSSYKPLKYLAIAFGFWTGLGRWILCLIIPITIAILPLEVMNTQSYSCRVHCTFYIKPYNYIESWYFTDESEFVYFITLLTVVPSYLMMIYCIRNLSNYPKALRLPDAFQLAKTTKMFNIIIFVSLTMIILMLTQIYVSSKGVLHHYQNNVENSYQTFVTNQTSHIAWRLFTSIVIWQAVISCLVFGVVTKALQALVDNCFKRITTMQADCVEDYIQVHQELCCKVESTFAAYRKWFLVNTFACIILISCVVFETASFIFGRTLEEYYFASNKEALCFYNFWPRIDPVVSFLVIHYYCFSILFLYASFVCYYPWYSMAHLRRSFNVIIQKLNTKTDWSPQHPFKNRLHLNSFIQYAKNTKYCSFMKFTCSSKIPYISILLAMCGLFFTLSNQFSHKDYNPYRIIRNRPI